MSREKLMTYVRRFVPISLTATTPKLTNVSQQSVAESAVIFVMSHRTKSPERVEREDEISDGIFFRSKTIVKAVFSNI